MKWLFLVLFIGCVVNALGLSSDDNEDELDENETFYSNVTSAEKPQTSKEERLKWADATEVFLVLFLIFAFFR